MNVIMRSNAYIMWKAYEMWKKKWAKQVMKKIENEMAKIINNEEMKQ